VGHNLKNTHFRHILKKEATQKAPKNLKMIKCTLKWQCLIQREEGKSIKYLLQANFDKKVTQKSTKKLQDGNTWLDSGRERKSIKK
jgi:hypothetical protein